MTERHGVLLGQRFAPVTLSIGFVRADLPDVRAFIEEWYTSIKRQPFVRDLEGDLPSFLAACELLTWPETKNLLVRTADAHTAVFLNSAGVPSPAPFVAYLCRQMDVAGLCVTAAPTTYGNDGRQMMHGVVRFEKFEPAATEFLQFERMIEVAFVDGKWTFELAGTQQPFENPEAYKARKIKDRFTEEMLERYCAALGVRPFDPDYYSRKAVLIEWEGVGIQRQTTFGAIQTELRIPVMSD